MCYEAVAPAVDERTEGDPAELVVANASLKARAVARRAELEAGDRVLGVDTCVALGATIYGKPQGEDEARRQLAVLAGREHTVWSGIALLEGRPGPGAGGVAAQTLAVATAVRFRSLSAAERDWYIASGEWRERAGGYAIQSRGAALVESIDGDYCNVVGLPVYGLVSLAPDLFRS